MENKWSAAEASEFIAKYGEEWGEDLALRTYSSRLIGRERELVLHGGGNTAVKGTFTNIFGQPIPAIYTKASGHNLAHIEPEEHTGLYLAYLQRLQGLAELSEEAMLNELLTHRLYAQGARPSIETLMHTFLSPKYPC